jgi:hypothetical protein
VITSDTPETDAAWDKYISHPYTYGAGDLRILAQRLERERDEAREVASGLAIQEERVNEALKELSSIHQWIDRNHPDGFIDSLTYLQNLERVTDNWYDRLDRLEVDANRFERERDEARHKLELCMAANSDVARIAKERDEAITRRMETIMQCELYEQERDEAREQIKELIYIAERAIALAEIDFENDKFGVASELRYELKQIMQEGAK